MAQVEFFGWLERLFEKSGLAVVLLACLGFAIWRLFRWAQPHVDALVKSHLDFVTQNSQTGVRQQELMEQQRELMERQGEVLNSIHDLAKDLASGDQRRHWDTRFDRIERELKRKEREPGQ